MEGHAGFKKYNNTSLSFLYMLTYRIDNPHVSISNHENA
jgi:hypothetical protein